MGVFIGIIGPVTLVSELKALGGHIVAHDVSACFFGAQTRGTQNECCVSIFIACVSVFLSANQFFFSRETVAWPPLFNDRTVILRWGRKPTITQHQLEQW